MDTNSSIMKYLTPGMVIHLIKTVQLSVTDPNFAEPDMLSDEDIAALVERNTIDSDTLPIYDDIDDRDQYLDGDPNDADYMLPKDALDDSVDYSDGDTVHKDGAL